MIYIRSLNCCGLAEIHNLSSHCRNQEGAVKAFVDAMRPYDGTYPYRRPDKEWKTFGQAIFTSAGRTSRYGERFASYLQAQQLGEVIEVKRFINPNTKRPIRTFLWQIDWDALKQWCLDREVKLPHQDAVDF